MLTLIFNYILRMLYRLYGKLIFGKLGKNSYVIKPMRIIGGKNIFIDKNVYIWNNARIEGLEKYLDKTYKPEIKFCEGSSVQQNLHLTCANRIEVGKNTAIAANVTITDIHHPYTDINIPIEHQNLEVSEVIIGEDSKIYNNAVILPGVHIGKHVTIGANSVVTKDIPDYCVAAGSPAKVIKKYNFKTNSWEKIS